MVGGGGAFSLSNVPDHMAVAEFHAVARKCAPRAMHVMSSMNWILKTKGSCLIDQLFGFVPNMCELEGRYVPVEQYLDRQEAVILAEASRLCGAYPDVIRKPILDPLFSSCDSAVRKDQFLVWLRAFFAAGGVKDLKDRIQRKQRYRRTGALEMKREPLHQSKEEKKGEAKKKNKIKNK
jgi:hypothetical protein